MLNTAMIIFENVLFFYIYVGHGGQNDNVCMYVYNILPTIPQSEIFPTVTL